MYKSLMIFIVGMMALLISTNSEARHWKSYKHHRQPHYYYSMAKPNVIHWGHSQLYHYPNGLITAKHYTKRTIHDIISLCQHHGIRTILLVRSGYPGAIPNHLRRYAHHHIKKAGLHYSYYTPRSYHSSPYKPFYYYDSPGFSIRFRF